MPEITIPNNWRPRWYQRPVWDYLENGGKRAVCIWHRRAGKDDIGLHRIAVSAFERPATYWHMLPEYGQGRKAIWTAVNPHTGRRRIDEAFPSEIIDTRNEQEMFIRFVTGATYQVVGSDRYDAAVGSPPAGIVFSEWALSNPAAFGYLAPILAENGGWALFITTSRGNNHAKTLLETARTQPGWFAEVLTVDDTKALSKEIIEEQRVTYRGIFGDEAGDALIEQEYFCSFNAAILGAYYGKEMRIAEQSGRICDLPINWDLPVNTAWDIGVDDAMAIWAFQIYPDHLAIVDYLENSGKGFDFYCEELDKRKYHGTDWVPHDAKVREPGAPGARTRIETLIALGRRPELAPDQKLMDGINAARKTIPVARFDKTRCAQGLECLREYKAEWDEQVRVFKKTPLHNWASHGADAWRYLSNAWRAPMKLVEDESRKPDYTKPMGGMTIGEFIEAEEAPRREDRA